MKMQVHGDRVSVVNLKMNCCHCACRYYFCLCRCCHRHRSCRKSIDQPERVMMLAIRPRRRQDESLLLGQLFLLLGQLLLQILILPYHSTVDVAAQEHLSREEDGNAFHRRHRYRLVMTLSLAVRTEKDVAGQPAVAALKMTMLAAVARNPLDPVGLSAVLSLPAAAAQCRSEEEAF